TSRPVGFPHSEISGSKIICISPELIAAYHVLHQRRPPRHPPYALCSLAISFDPQMIRLIRYELTTLTTQFTIEVLDVFTYPFFITDYIYFSRNRQQLNGLWSSLTRVTGQ